MAEARSPIAITLSVWKAIFLREALDRLFDMRAAWLWLLLEPVLHIVFITFVVTVVRLRTVGGIDVVIWVIVGLLAFFLFRRTAVQTMHAVDSNKPLFAYRQVQPFDTAVVRAGLEGFLMILVGAIILSAAALFGYDVWPGDPLQVGWAMLGLWLLALGYGLVTSVLMELIPELEHIFKILMLPLYLVSGVIFPLSAVPEPYREWLMYNPIAHGLELVRHGFSPYYHMVQGVSASYLYAWVVCSILLGLMLYRRFSVQLVMK